MEVVQQSRGVFRVAERAKVSLGKGLESSRRPYLAMGLDDSIDQLIEMLKGNFASPPLYGSEQAAATLMDEPEVAREVSYGLASRARNFAEPLAEAIKPFAKKARIMADVGAGSPYVAVACARVIPHLAKVYLVDRANGLQYAKEMAADIHDSRIEFAEHDFFQHVPPADLYCLSNTAHDWLKDEYASIMTNVRDSIAPEGIVCIHEPLLLTNWNSAAEWVHALWMASYALALYKLTEGKGTCYTRQEHNQVMEQCHFLPLGDPVETRDGCTALFYKCAGDADPEARPSPGTMTQHA